MRPRLVGSLRPVAACGGIDPESTMSLPSLLESPLDLSPTVSSAHHQYTLSLTRWQVSTPRIASPTPSPLAPWP